MTVSVILGIGMSIGLFFLLPTLLGSVVTFLRTPWWSAMWRRA